MESDSWARVAAASKRHQPRYDLYLGYEETNDGGDEDHRAEYPCPFCSEDFDIVDLCCHVDDEHQVEAKNGVCPVCQVRFGTDLIAHITMEHENVFKTQRRRRLRKGSSGSHSAISFLRKELREGNLQSLLGGSSFPVTTSSPTPDPLLSFINLSLGGSPRDTQPEASDEGGEVSKISCEEVVESLEPSLSHKDQEERARRSDFVQEILQSTIFDDYL